MTEHSYFRPREYTLRQVCFKYLGGEYSGPGLLTWKPESGFHLEAFIERSGAPLPTPIKLAVPRTTQDSDQSTIRMWIRHGGLAIARAALVDRFDILMRHRLSINLPKVAFLARSKVSSKTYAGFALLDLGSSPVLTDKIHEKVKLNNRVFSERHALSGISAPRTPHRVSGMLIDDRHLLLSWSLDRSRYRKQQGWRWPDAFRYALSAVSNRSVALLRREVPTGPLGREEVHRAAPVHLLDPYILIKGDIPNKKHLFALTHLFLRDDQPARTARHIMRQAFRANSQASWADSEL